MREDSEEDGAVVTALEQLAGEIETEGVSAAVYSDESAMTPMLVVDFERYGERADILRRLFEADGPVSVDSVHRHRAVVRGDEST
jgi:hypothetical protein